MPVLEMISHRDQHLLLIDLSDLKDDDDALARLAAVRKFVTAQPERSVLTVTKMDRNYWSQVFIDALRELVKADAPHVKASAVAGQSMLQRVVFRALMQILASW